MLRSGEVGKLGSREAKKLRNGEVKRLGGWEAWKLKGLSGRQTILFRASRSAVDWPGN
jgi:hypothetical protein